MDSQALKSKIAENTSYISSLKENSAKQRNMIDIPTLEHFIDFFGKMIELNLKTDPNDILHKQTLVFLKLVCAHFGELINTLTDLLSQNKQPKARQLFKRLRKDIETLLSLEKSQLGDCCAEALYGSISVPDNSELPLKTKNLCEEIVYEDFRELVAIKALKTLRTEDDPKKICSAFKTSELFVKDSLIENKKLYKRSLKLAYVAFCQRLGAAAREKKGSFLGRKTFNALQNSVIDLYTISPGISQRYTFLYLKSLAADLHSILNSNKTTSKSHLISKKPKNISSALNNTISPRFVHCLSLWAQILSKTQEDSASNNVNFGSALVSLGLATLEAFPSPNYFPLRIGVIHVLVDFLAAFKGRVFAPLCLHILPLIAFYKRKNAKAPPCDIRVDWRRGSMLKNSDLKKSFDFLFGVGLELFGKYFGVFYEENKRWGDFLGFALRQLRAVSKEFKNTHYKTKLNDFLIEWKYASED